MASDWDWDEQKESTVVEPVEAIAVYTNPKGNIVIRQQSFLDDADSVVIVPRKMVDAVVKAMKAELAKK